MPTIVVSHSFVQQLQTVNDLTDEYNAARKANEEGVARYRAADDAYTTACLALEANTGSVTAWQKARSDRSSLYDRYMRRDRLNDLEGSLRKARGHLLDMVNAEIMPGFSIG